MLLLLSKNKWKDGKILKLFTFKRGIHPLHNIASGKKETRSCPIREYVPKKVVLPTNMHIGAPSNICVKKGERVLMGQVIAEAVGALGIPVHASVSGIVSDVSSMQVMGKLPVPCITIENDFLDEWVELKPVAAEISEDISKEAILGAIQNAGICGMGGASFPTHFKLTIPEGKYIDTIILNGAECETFLNADFRLMLEHSEKVIAGLRLVLIATGVKKGFIGIEDNKKEAIEAMTRAASKYPNIEVCALKTKYPQGGEKQLIHALTKREVPSGGLPLDAHVVVLNVATAAAIADAVLLGKPLIERVTTVCGNINKPDNLLLRIGTSISEAVEACGSYKTEPGKIIFGGSMTGNCVPDDSYPILKGNNGVVVFSEKDSTTEEESPCIRCGKCVQACPIGLNPARLQYLCNNDKIDAAVDEHLLDCILCNSCSFVCPAKRQLGASFKNAKEIVAGRRAKK